MSLALYADCQIMEPSDEQYLIINALQTLELLERYLYERSRGLWFIETPSQVLPRAVIMRDGDIYPVDWVQ